jgi:endonuclease YncB( thermonuclease family)
MAVLAGAIATPISAHAQDRRPSDVPAGDLARVTGIVDARTITVALNGTSATITLAGIDAPVGSACLAGGARNSLASLLNGRLVKLVRDNADQAEGAAARRFVYRIDGPMAQEELLTAGLARSLPAYQDASNASSFAVLESQARAAGRGGWARCGWTSNVQAPVENGCRVLDLERLMTPVASLPEMADASSGTCVKIVKAKNEASDAWSGIYTFQPKGSSVKQGVMYARWKDGFVLLTQNDDGAWIANIVQGTYKARIFPWERNQGWQSTIPGETRILRQALERQDTDTSIVRIPNPQTNLFRDRGNGQYEALTDVFVYQSGEARIPRRTTAGLLE